jgi:ElaB/YqjD/DUF883 family membrane-anchored ribosome-binding protein
MCGNKIQQAAFHSYYTHIGLEQTMANTTKRGRTSTTSRAHARGRTSRQTTSSPFYADAIGFAGSLLRSRQDVGAEKISDVAQSVRKFATEFESLPNIQNYVSAAADQMEMLADYVSETRLETIVDDANTFARQHPMATMAFAVAAGFTVTRILAGDTQTLRGNRNATNARNGNTRNGTPRKRATSRLAQRGAPRKSQANGRDTAASGANA